MKRVASTIFLLIFTASVLGRTVERTEAWAAQHAHNPKQAAPVHKGLIIAEAHKQTVRQGQTKLSEDGSILEAAFVRSLTVPPAASVLLHGPTDLIADPDNRILSSRAPPSLLS